MTTDDDVALKDLVSQTLDARGILPKIRAELRANVFLALNEKQDLTKLANNELTNLAKTENGCLILNLIREFLTYYDLDFTLSVFNPESQLGTNYAEMKKNDLVNKLNLNSSDSEPLLCQILKKLKNNQGLQSPVALNSTYTKTAEEEEEKKVEEDEDEPYSVVTESISEASIKEEESGRNTPNLPNDESINMMMFTPVQQVRTVPKEKTDDEKPSKLSLNDLPPLGTPITVGSTKHIAQLRKRLEEGFADDSNSETSKNSEETLHDDDDDAINELLNDSSDSKHTADETVSKISNFDHIESV